MLYFTPPTEFNDPFDCQCIVPYYYLPVNEIPKTLTRIFRENNVPTHLIADKVARELELWPRTDEEKRDASHALAKKSALRLGIFSLSVDGLNILMSSHYSNGHTGFTIGFNGELLVSSLPSEEWGKPTEVSYDDEYPAIDPTDQSPESNEQWIKVFCSKARCWEYEKEFRMIGEAKYKLKLKPGTIDQVILGINISSENRTKIIEILSSKEKRPKLYRSFPAIGTFKIELEEINY
ncbi:MAG TPA: DUF2971 domain-containing protein [Candidatus Kapabacteria bacterium]|nr:DUF2971 domain-containing protein [Candidatus Kapabacteria bacterium]